MFEAAQLVNQASGFTQSKRLLPSKRLPTTGFCSEPHESILHPHIRVLSFFSTHSHRMVTENNFERDNSLPTNGARRLPEPIKPVKSQLEPTAFPRT